MTKRVTIYDTTDWENAEDYTLCKYSGDRGHANHNWGTYLSFNQAKAKITADLESEIRVLQAKLDKVNGISCGDDVPVISNPFEW